MWAWVNSGRWWWTGRPGVLRFMGSKRVGHDWATELNWTGLCVILIASTTVSCCENHNNLYTVFQYSLALASALSRSVVSDSLQRHGQQPSRLLCPWNFPGKNTGVGCYFILQGIFSTYRLNPHLWHLLHWQVDFFFPPLRHLGLALTKILLLCVLLFLFSSSSPWSSDWFYRHSAPFWILFFP